MPKISLKKDKYNTARGGYSRLLDISCGKCDKHLFYYQKDGPGTIERLYFDRIYESPQYSGLEKVALSKAPQLICPNCKRHIGVPYLYEKENRLAFRLFVLGITKKVVSAS